MATAKAFPWHGDTAVDSHLSLPVMKMDRQRLETLELIPFKRQFRAAFGL
jgi:beta-glucosidase-like glycosyl hydrolase